MCFVFLSNRVGKMLTTNLCNYTIISKRDTRICEEYLKAKISLASIGRLEVW